MKKLVLFGFLVSVILAVIFSHFASKLPDGLEKIAEEKEFLEKNEGKEVFSALLLDYVFPGIKNEIIAGSLAGLIGVLLTFGITTVLAYLLRKRASYKKKNV